MFKLSVLLAMLVVAVHSQDLDSYHYDITDRLNDPILICNYDTRDYEEPSMEQQVREDHSDETLPRSTETPKTPLFPFVKSARVNRAEDYIQIY